MHSIRDWKILSYRLVFLDAVVCTYVPVTTLGHPARLGAGKGLVGLAKSHGTISDSYETGAPAGLLDQWRSCLYSIVTT